MSHEIVPNELARQAGVDPKTFRAWLRRRWRDGDVRLRQHSLNERWTFDAEVALSLLADFRRREDASALEAASVGAVGEATIDPRCDWFWEGNVQVALVAHLEREGWKIVRTADAGSRERGIDVVAERGGRTMAVEVKGFPSTLYASGPQVGQPKRTSPSTEVRHWFAAALLAAALLGSSSEFDDVALAFPDHPRLRGLVERTRWALERLETTVYLVAEDGSVETLVSA
ncbi:MAG: hypothetical protein M3R70_10735 [Actinomycetota bacterium]|nr:hypothetical protein [Actinomycetota bacterium]